MTRTQIRRTLCAAVAVAVAAAGLSIARAEDDCKATLESALRTKETKDTVTTYVFKVDVSTLEACASITYKLTTTEQLPSGETKAFETPGEVRLRNGSTTQKLTYDLKKGNKMVEWKIEKTGCTLCEP